MATFPGPVAAIRAAQRLQREARDLGVRLRACMHIGDVQEREGLLSGIAAHGAARVMVRIAGFTRSTGSTVRANGRRAGFRFIQGLGHHLRRQFGDVPCSAGGRPPDRADVLAE